MVSSSLNFYNKAPKNYESTGSLNQTPQDMGRKSDIKIYMNWQMAARNIFNYF
jgi:hypothetical protein